MSEQPVILIVDDEPQIRSALRRLLEREQYEVLEAPGTHEALKIAQRQRVDLVISDYLMPESNGLDLLVQMKKHHPRTVRIIMTGKADLNTVVTAINEGHVYRFMLKPWDNDELCLSVRLALEQAKLLSENRQLVERLESQESILRNLAAQYPGITTVERDAEGAIVLEDPDDAAA